MCHNIRCFVVIFFLVLFKDFNGQEFWKSKTKFGFSISHGNQLFLATNYEYKVSLFNVFFYRKILSKKSWGIDLSVNPHFGTSQLQEESDIKISLSGHEFGLNLGFLIHKNIYKDKIHLFTSLSAGPHYISESIIRQSNGFIFSDNISAGVMIKFDTSCFIHGGVGMRHLSNARLSYPNGGINNTMFQLGIILITK